MLFHLLVWDFSITNAVQHRHTLWFAMLHWFVCKLFNTIVIEINKGFIVLKMNIIRSLKYSVRGNKHYVINTLPYLI